MKIAITGGRDFDDLEFLVKVLNEVQAYFHIDKIAFGDAKGADAMAKAWASANHVEHQEYKADWDKFGKAAGHIRNHEMLKSEKPDKLIAFPGGKGTDGCVEAALKMNIDVIDLRERQS